MCQIQIFNIFSFFSSIIIFKQQKYQYKTCIVLFSCFCKALHESNRNLTVISDLIKIE